MVKTRFTLEGRMVSLAKRGMYPNLYIHVLNFNREAGFKRALYAYRINRHELGWAARNHLPSWSIRGGMIFEETIVAKAGRKFSTLWHPSLALL
jgi:hypothetical protein